MTTATWVCDDLPAGASFPGASADAAILSAAGSTLGTYPAVGTIKRFYDTTGKYGEGEFIYLPGVASLAVGDMVNYLLSAGVAAATDATVTRWAGTANTGLPLAVATTANTSATTFSWYQIGGAAVVNTSGTVAAGDKAFWQATAKISSTALAGKEVLGMVAASANGVPATNQAIYTLSRPVVQGAGLGAVAVEVNTAISTAGAGTLTAAGIVGGMITRTGPSAAYTDTTDTAVAIIAALPGASVGQSWELTIKNTVPFTCTLSGGVGVTLSGQTLIPGNSVGRYLLTMNGATTVTMVGQSVVPMTTPPILVSTALTTVGAGTITAAGIVGGFTNRTGATSAFVDTTDTAVNIIAALPNANVGQSFIYTYYNNTLGNSTVTAGAGVTVTAGIVPFNMWAEFLVTVATASTITMVAVAMGPCVALPVTKNTTNATATLAAGDITGAQIIAFTATGANATVTTRTATQMFADLPNAQIGLAYVILWRNTNGTTNTITAADGSVTLTGTMTVAQNVTRTLTLVFTSAVACTITSYGISAAAA